MYAAFGAGFTVLAACVLWSLRVQRRRARRMVAEAEARLRQMRKGLAEFETAGAAIMIGGPIVLRGPGAVTTVFYKADMPFSQAEIKGLKKPNGHPDL